MNTKYKIIINTHHKKTVVFYGTEAEIKQYDNIASYIRSMLGNSLFYNITRISVRLYNKYTRKHYISVVFDREFEELTQTGQRVEVTYKWGEKERFYVVKSTGWLSCYISIPQKNSIGGCGIHVRSITNIKRLNKWR